MPISKKKLPSNVIFIRMENAELKLAFKAYCARRGISMKDSILNFMLDAIKQDGKIL